MNQGPRELARALAAAAARRDLTTTTPTFFDAKAAAERAALADLLADPTIVVVDTIHEQLRELVQSRSPRLREEDIPAAIAELLGGRPAEELGAWVHYPWRARVVHVLPEGLHRELRLDRNRYKITPEEQARLLSLRIVVVGLSVGRAIVSTLLHEGIGGTFVIADFDTLSVSNLNRLASGVADVGIAKVVLAAREIAELDPYVRVVTFPRGVDEASIEEILSGADVVIDECDDLAMKLELRERARLARLPVIMATSDRGMIDIERFDREPERAAFHGMLGRIDASELRGLTLPEKVPYVLRLLEAERLTERTVASLVEIDETVSTWPQLASDVVLGGAMVANAVRRIALGTLGDSGRFHADLDVLVADGRAATVSAWTMPAEGPRISPSRPRMPAPGTTSAPTRDELRFVVACATLAPSGGNAQPWRFEARESSLLGFVDPARATSLLDRAARASHLALGAALEGAIIAATALGFDASLTTPSVPDASWQLELTRTSRARDEGAARLLAERCSNRRTAKSAPIPEDVALAVAERGAPLGILVVGGERLELLGAALGQLDRVRFLSPRLRRELFSELRWTPDEALQRGDGIDLDTLELGAGGAALLGLIRTETGLDLLARLGRGHALGRAARSAFARAGAALVLSAHGTEPSALVDAGRGLLRLWLAATRHGLAVHPWGSPFLFHRLLEAPATFEPWEREAMTTAADAFRQAVPLERERPPLLVLRLSTGDPPTVRSCRRSVDDVLSFR